MREYLEVLHEEGYWLTEPLLKIIGSQTCRSKQWSSLRNMIGAKSLLLSFISQEVFLIPYPTCGHLPNGLDIVGPFPKATCSRRWLLVATDYFTKWVEAAPCQHSRHKC